jgi:hypothetical protein
MFIENNKMEADEMASALKEVSDAEAELFEAMEEASSQLYSAAVDKTAALMREHGEDPADPLLLAMRTEQLLYGVNSMSRQVRIKAQAAAETKRTGAASATVAHPKPLKG